MSDKTCRLSRYDDKSCSSVFKCFTTCPCPEKNLPVRDEFAEKCKVAYLAFYGITADMNEHSFKDFLESCRKAGLK